MGKTYLTFQTKFSSGLLFKSHMPAGLAVFPSRQNSLLSYDPRRVLSNFHILWSKQSQPVCALPNAKVPGRQAGVRAVTTCGTLGSQRPLCTYLLLTSMRLSLWTAKSCALCACFISSERPYRKWSSPGSEHS